MCTYVVPAPFFAKSEMAVESLGSHTHAARMDARRSVCARIGVHESNEIESLSLIANRIRENTPNAQHSEQHFVDFPMHFLDFCTFPLLALTLV